MPRIQESIEINIPRADVFKFCHDIGRRPEWDEQVAHIELLSPKPIRQGTLLSIDAKGGAVFSWDAEYVAYQFPSESKLRVLDVARTAPFGRGSELRWQFAQSGGSTRMSWVWDYKANGIIASILDMLGKRVMTRRAIKRSLANLKQVLESGGRVI